MSVATTASTYQPRHFYGAKFELPGILHGAGQTYYRGGAQSTAYERYADVLGADAYPLLYMDYNNWMEPATWYDGLQSRLDAIQADDNRFALPQLGMVLPPGTTRLTQQQIDTLVDGLGRLNRPVYFRPGYEANGPWNGLDANTFKQNFRAIAEAVRAADLPVAMVWNVVVGDGGGYSTYGSAANFYPGDEYVDWWSFNNFGPVTFDNSFWDGQVDQFLAASHLAGKPVMIGEATPQFVGADDPLDWVNWFAKFFDRIRDNPGIKAHTYINWDWTTTNPADGWTGWGDARLETGSTTLVANYQAELSNPIYLHALATNIFVSMLSGDYDGNGLVGQEDLDLVLLNWGLDGSTPPVGWVNELPSGLIGQSELDSVLLNWGASLEPGGSLVPEPALAVTWLGLVGTYAARRHR